MKQHRILALCVSVLTAGAATALAQTTGTPATTPAPSPTPAPTAAAPATPAAPAPPSLSTTITATYVSQYMFRGQRLGGEAFQPEIALSYGNWAFDVWNSDPISAKVPGQSDPEIDPQGSYTFAINDSFAIIPGFTWYNYPSAPTDQGFFKSTFEPNLALNYTVAGVKLAPEIYYDVVLKGPTYEFDAYYTIPLKDINSEIDFTGTAGTYKITDAVKGSSPKTKAWGDYYLIGFAMPYSLTKALKLTAGWAYTKGTDAFFKQGSFPKSANTAALSRGVATVTLGYSF